MFDCQVKVVLLDFKVCLTPFVLLSSKDLWNIKSGTGTHSKCLSEKTVKSATCS